MAVNKEDTKYQVKIVYKASYDTSGSLDLADWTQTFSNVDEQATTAQLLAYGQALAGLTVYREAPYQVQLIDTSKLVEDGE